MHKDRVGAEEGEKQSHSGRCHEHVCPWIVEHHVFSKITKKLHRKHTITSSV